mgnify:CR=1 FL=1
MRMQKSMYKWYTPEERKHIEEAYTERIQKEKEYQRKHPIITKLKRCKHKIYSILFRFNNKKEDFINNLLWKIFPKAMYRRSVKRELKLTNGYIKKKKY